MLGVGRGRWRRVPWNEEHKSYIREMLAAGLSLRKVSDLCLHRFNLNCTPGAVQRFAQKNNLYEVYAKKTNTKPVGFESYRWNSGHLYYWYVKIAEGVWKLKHHHIWEQHYGRAVPPGHIVRFLDGDHHNMDIENLALVSKSVHNKMNRNRYGSMPSELRKVFKTMLDLEAAIEDKERDL